MSVFSFTYNGSCEIACSTFNTICGLSHMTFCNIFHNLVESSMIHFRGTFL